jgi:anti-anti-sigma factor
MTIYTAAAHKEQLMNAIAARTSIEVDLAKVTEIDTAGLQLLALAKLEARRRELPLSFVGHSRAVLEAIDVCDMSSFFGDPVLIPSANAAEGVH